MITSLHSSAARLYTSETPVPVYLLEGNALDSKTKHGIPNNISNLRAFDDPGKDRDLVQLSNEARDILQDKKPAMAAEKEAKEKKEKETQEPKSVQKEKELGPGELSDSEKKEVQELKKIDQRVKAHEQAHKAAGGQYIRSGVNLQYTTGPDGQRYAVAGEVSIDVSEIPDDPEATIRKMETVRRAALAPQDPSPQDRRVASEAAQKAAKARSDAASSPKETDSIIPEAGQELKSPLEEVGNKNTDDLFNPEADTYQRNSQETFAPGSFLELVA